MTKDELLALPDETFVKGGSRGKTYYGYYNKSRTDMVYDRRGKLHVIASFDDTEEMAHKAKKLIDDCSNCTWETTSKAGCLHKC
jgi:hypothetical protein